MKVEVEDVLAIFGNQDDPLAAAQTEPEVDQPTEHVVGTPVDAAGEEPVYPDRLEYVWGGQPDLDLESADWEAAERAVDVVTEDINEENNEEVDEGAAEGVTEEAAVEAAEQAVEVEGESAKPGKLDIHPSPAFISGKKRSQGYNTDFFRKNLGGDFTRIRALTASIRKENRKKRRIFPRPAFPWKWDESRRQYVERSE